MEHISTELILDDIPQKVWFLFSATLELESDWQDQFSPPRIKTAQGYFSTIISKPHNFFLNCDAGTKVDKYNNRTEYSNRLIR